MEIVNMPRLSLNEDSSVIGEWLVKEGDKVQKGDGLFSIETDKSSMTVYAESSGVVLKCFYGDYDVVPVMTPVCVIGEPGEDVSKVTAADGAQEPTEAAITANEEKAEPAAMPEKKIAEPEQETFLSPRAKKLAAENGVDTSGIIPSGAEGRILEADVILAMGKPVAADSKLSAVQEPVIPQNQCEMKDGVREIKLSGIRRVIAKNMMHSLASTAQLTSHMSYNASKIQKYREWLKLSPGPEKGITITDMILYAVAKTLKDFDYMNAHMVSDEKLLYFEDVNLGCAVDTERGLMVPTIKKAQDLSLPQLSQRLKELAEKCRDGSILPDEMSAATFTVSNLGSFGVTGFTPILNPPQVGIIGIDAIGYAVKKTDEGLLYYPEGRLSLTYDHRAVDGAPSARFLRAVCKNLERFDELV